MHWFTSRLDHFDRQVTATWQQRSFQNDTFFDGRYDDTFVKCNVKETIVAAFNMHVLIWVLW